MAEGAGGKEVGRISIRVVPNTENFRRDLQRQLDEIEKETVLKIRMDLDMDGFREKVDAATRNLKDAKVKVKTEFDNQGKLIHDLDSAIGDAGGRVKAIEPKIKPKIDEADFQAQLRAVKAQARLADAKVNIDFDDRVASAKLEGEILKLKALAQAQSIDLKIGERVEGGGRGRRGFGGGNRNGGAFDVLPNIGGLGGVPSILLIVGALSLLAPALSLVAQAIVGLPALVAGIALPIGVFALGIGGIKKALDDSGILKDAQEFTKKGKPKGKDKQSLGASLKELQQQVSDVFEKGFTPLFRQVGAVIPSLTRGLPFVAQGIVNLAAGITKAVTSTQNVANFDRFTNSVSTMLTNLAPAFTSFGNAMSNLITNVGDHLPGLGNVMTGWADRFSNWVSAISKPKQFWGKDTPNSSTLDSAVSNMKPILNSVVDFVGKLADAGLKLASNPEMAANIKKTVDGLTNLAIEALPGLNSAFGQLAGILSSFGLNTRSLNDPGHPGQFWGKPTTGKQDDQANGFRIPGMKGQDGSWFGPDTKSWIPKILRPDGLDQIFKNMGLDQLWSSLGAGQAGAAPAPFNPGTPASPNSPVPVTVVPGAGASSLFPGGPGNPVQSQPQQAQQVQSPKVDMNGVTQSIQGGAGAIAAAANAVFKGLSDAATVAVSQAVQAVQQLPGAIAQALSGVYAAALAAGQSIGTGMAAGIAASAPSAIAAAQALAQGVTAAAHTTLVINSPSKVFHGIGLSVGEGFTDGLEGGAPGVIDAANRLAQQVTDAVASHNIGGNLKGQVKDQLKAITVEQDRLRADKDGTADKGQKKAIQGQIDQLNVSKDQLKASASQLGYSQKYGDSQSGNIKQQEAALDVQRDQIKAQLDQTTDKGKRRELQVQLDNIKAQKDQLKLEDKSNGRTGKKDDLNEQLGQSLNKMVDIGKNFAMANVNQFESDIGISGQGAIPTIANIGLNWATGMLGNMVTGALGGGGQTHIHVNNVDDAVEAHTRTANKQAMQYTGRSSST